MREDLERREALRRFAESHGLTIHDYDLYDRALTHSSTAAEGPDSPPDYESLEFLGDAVLGLAAAHYLFETHPGLTPGDYTRLRAALVNRDSVARVGTDLGVAPLIRLGRGEEMAGGRQRRALMADCVEALIGAVYLDSGWKDARAFVIYIFAQEFARAEQTAVSGDYKSRLQEHCQAMRIGLPRFEVIEEVGPDHNKLFHVEVYVHDKLAAIGSGQSKKRAQQEAARSALELLAVEEKLADQETPA